MRRLAIIITHPIQYYAPMFRLLAEDKDIDLKVFYTWSQAKESVKDKTFGKDIKWDIPLLEGYTYEFVENVSNNPGSNRWNGIVNPKLISKIQIYQPNAILIFGWNMKSHFKVMRFFRGKIPVWFRGDSTLLDEETGYRKILRRVVLTFVYRYIDKALYVGKANKAYFLKHGINPKQLILVPHAVDNKRFGNNDQILNEKALRWRQKMGFSKDDIVILFAGKFENKKQPDFLVHAFKSANDLRVDHLKLVLLGAGPLKESLTKLVDNDTKIHFLPFQNQSMMPLVYRLCDIMCLPSKGPGETWGLAVNEAMACGRPVIVSNKVGCAQDLVKHNENGFIFDHDSQYQLESIFVSLKKEQCLILGKQAYKDIQSWSFEKQTESISILIKEAGNTYR